MSTEKFQAMACRIAVVVGCCALVLPAAAATIEPVRSARSGAWSNASTWEGGARPANGDSVLIRAGHEIRYDVDSPNAYRVVWVAGTLRFATDRDTQLVAGLIRIEPGETISEEGFECDTTQHHASDHAQHGSASQAVPALEVGSPDRPIEPGCRALIRLKYFDGMNQDSCPAIVCCGGRMDFHGAPMNRTWVKLARTTDEAATEVELAERVIGWRPGDRVLVPSTARIFLFDDDDKAIPSARDHTESEERTITAIVGQKILLDQPLEFEHQAAGDYCGEVANLSRNVIIESADPAGPRGHTMYHRGSTGSISYAEFRNLGKRGLLGRYPIHFHLCRDTMRGSYVIGASVHDSDNRMITIHGTDYLVVRDCVGYNSIGHGYFFEDGTEVFNVLDRNLAVQARHGEPLPLQSLPFDHNEGAGFWWANSLNTFTRNVAAECDQYGFRFEMVKTDSFDPVLLVPQADGSQKLVDTRTLPFVRFEGNEAHTIRRFALNLGGIRHVATEADHQEVHKANGDLSKIQGGHVDGIGPDSQHPFIVRDFRVWNSQWVFHGCSPNVLIDGLHARGCSYAIFKPQINGHEYRNLDLEKIDAPEIFQPWGVSSIAENYFAYLNPVDDLPPTTVITHVRETNDGILTIRGTTAENVAIKFVKVNGEVAHPVEDTLTEWEVVLDDRRAVRRLEAFAEDAAGNVEPRPHVVPVLKRLTIAQQAIPD